MVRRRIGEATEMMRGELVSGDPERYFDGAVLDSRQVKGGELFFALAGARTDGHVFVGDALGRGAAAAVVERPPGEAEAEAAVIRVNDSFEALHDLTRGVRTQVPQKLVAVTGSVGKTTVKELLAAMLASRYRVARNPGNLNNLYGFPVALLGIPDDTEWMVAEMGMSQPGELARISRLGRPDVAVFINVRPVHLEFFEDLEAIREAKAELLQGLASDGLVVASGDDPQVVKIARRHAGRVISFGRRQGLDVRAVQIRPAPEGQIGSRFVLQAEERGQEIRLPLYGLYNVDNCLAAAACAWTLGVSLEEIAAAVAGVEALGRRGVVHRLRWGLTIIDDTYNSNPEALAGALESAAELPARRRWAVLGDMLELGPEAARFHRQAGETAARKGFSPVCGVGEMARHLVDGAVEAGAEGHWFPDAAAAAAWARDKRRPGDLILVKASRGIGLEVVVEALMAGGEG